MRKAACNINCKIITLSILAGGLYWLADAVFDKFKFPNEPFLTILVYDAPTHVVSIRVFAVLLLIGIGMLSCLFLKRIKETEGNYRELFENVNDAIFVKPFDPEGREKFIEANAVSCRMLGYTRDELLQLSPLELVDPARLEGLKAAMGRLVAEGSTVFETALVGKNGKKVPTEINAHIVRLGGKRMCMAVVRDITVRKQVEAALRESERQLRHLTARLLKVQETERGRISKELHDQLGQSLMFQKLQISSIRERLPKRQSGLRNDCTNLLNHLDETVDNVRRLSQDLRPWGLDELGFPLAAKFLIEESCKLYGIQSQINLDEVEGLFSPEAQLNIYRIIQESLTNIGKHAQATEVSAEIKKQNGHVIIRIRDNGQGFDLKKFSPREVEKRGLGLSTIKERARILGGRLDIRSRKGRGTGITLSIPWGSAASEPERN